MPDPAPDALVIDPRGRDVAFVRRALRPEFVVRVAGSGDDAVAALERQVVPVAVEVSDHDAEQARRLIAEIGRRRPGASRVAIAAPRDPDVFGLEAAGAEHVVLRPLLEAALRLAVRSARRAFDLRRAVEGLRPDLGAIAPDLGAGLRLGE